MTDRYAYYVTRTKIREGRLLSAQEMKELSLAPTYRDAVQFLVRKGFLEGGTIEAMLSARRREMLDLIDEFTDIKNAFQILRIKYDFHNLKTAIKAQISDHKSKDDYLDGGTVPAEVIRDAVFQKKFGKLPKEMQQYAKTAQSLLLRTRDAGQFDCYLDRALLRTIYQEGQASEIPYLKSYAENYVAVYDIKIAYRCCMLKKSKEFMKRALAPCKSLATDQLAAQAAQGRKALCDYLVHTDYSAAAEAIQQSYPAFYRWCAGRLSVPAETEKDKAFGLSPIFAYLFFAEQEINQVRLILTLKQNHMPNELITERMWR